MPRCGRCLVKGRTVPSCLRLPSRGSQITFDIGIGARIEDRRTDLILTNDGDLPSLRMIWRNNLPTLTALLHDRTLRVAVTGLSQSGKTAFITSLVHNLVGTVAKL